MRLCECFCRFPSAGGYFKITNYGWLSTHIEHNTQTQHTLKKRCHLKTVIMVEQKVVLSFQKQIWNRYFKHALFYFLCLFLSNDSKGNFWRVVPTLPLYANISLKSILVTICTKDKI